MTESPLLTQADVLTAAGKMRRLAPAFARFIASLDAPAAQGALLLACLLLSELVRKGIIPPLYAESDDPDRVVPLLLRPDMVSIVVGGDPGRNQNRIYANNHAQGVPISRRVIDRSASANGLAGFTPAPWTAEAV